MGIRLNNRLRNEEIKQKTKITNVVGQIVRSKWLWTGYITRENPKRTTYLMQWKPMRKKLDAYGMQRKRTMEEAYIEKWLFLGSIRRRRRNV